MQRESISELLGQVAHNSATLVRNEIELAKQELREALKSISNGIILMAVGGVFAFAAFLTFCAAVVIGLTSVMTPGVAALVTGIALVVIAGIIAYIGLRQLKKSHLAPQKTIETLKETKKWLKEMT